MISAEVISWSFLVCFVYSFTGVAHSVRLDLSAVTTGRELHHCAHTCSTCLLFYLQFICFIRLHHYNGKWQIIVGMAAVILQHRLNSLWQLSCNFSKSSPEIVFEASWRTFKAFLSRWSHTDSMILRSGPGQSITDNVLLCVFYLDMLLLHW